MITEEMIETIYRRANEYAIVRFGSEPSRLELGENGIQAVWEHYRCGDYDTEYEYITAENLTEDLDEVARKRKIEQEEHRRAEEIRRKEEMERRERLEKEKRRQEYLKLKSEFEK